jgi:hypothetical protein
MFAAPAVSNMQTSFDEPLYTRKARQQRNITSLKIVAALRLGTPTLFENNLVNKNQEERTMFAALAVSKRYSHPRMSPWSLGAVCKKAQEHTACRCDAPWTLTL